MSLKDYIKQDWQKTKERNPALFGESGLICKIKDKCVEFDYKYTHGDFKSDMIARSATTFGLAFGLMGSPTAFAVSVVAGCYMGIRRNVDYSDY